MDQEPKTLLAVPAAPPPQPEIALETIAPWILKLMLYSWYGALAIALVMMAFDWRVQWECMNFCGGECTLEADGWDSQACIAATTNDTITWFGNVSVLTDSPLNRFMHLFWTISLPITKNGTGVPPPPLLFNIALRGKGNGTLGEDTVFDVSTNFTRSLYCNEHRTTCDLIVLPADMPPRLTDEEFVVTLFLTDIDPTVRAVASRAVIGTVSQRASYTLTGMVVRYVLLTFSFACLAHYLRMLGGIRHYPDMMVEQRWVFALQVSFVLYANPLHAWCIYDTYHVGRRYFLQFVEFHLAEYFAYVLLAWNVVVVNCVRVAPYPLPPTTHRRIVGGLFVMIGFDVLLIALNGADEMNRTSASYQVMPSWRDDWRVSTVVTLLLATQTAYFLCAVIQAIRLYFTLADVPYLETRSRQLSFRLFAFVMWLYFAFRMAQSLYLTSLSHNASVLSYQTDQKISEILIAFLFTQIVTYCYSPTHRDQNTPPPPSSNLWKTLPWGRKWHEWIHLHGGSMYFFNTQEEARVFEEIQTIGGYHPDVMSPFDAILDVGQAVSSFAGIRPSTSRVESHMFFCFETAVDCFNLSWEVYFTPPMELSTPLGPTDDPEGDDIELNAIPPPGQPSTAAEMNTERFGFSLVRAFLIEGMQACVFIRERDECIAVAFRGTSNATNVKYDFNLVRSKLSAGVIGTASKYMCLDFLHVPTVHTGFQTLWRAFQSEVTTAVDRLLAERPKAHVVITGHSLGGALANLCAYHLAQHLRVPPVVYTFGSPRLGNTMFKDLYEQAVPTTFRVVNQSDVISRMSMVPDNPHVGREVAIDNFGNIVCSPTFIERMLRPWGHGMGIQQHLLGQYHTSLDAVAARHGCPSRCLISVNYLRE